jgi:dihydroorotate dehydrogenase (NAD+) catalytic subunit
MISLMLSLGIDLVTGGKRSLSLANPVMTASGTFSNGIEYQRVFDIQRLGAIVSKAITLKPRKGNEQPRIAETAAGMINRSACRTSGSRQSSGMSLRCGRRGKCR